MTLGRYKKRELVHFGVDYFKAYISYNYTPKIYKLGLSRNSNLFFYNDDTYIEQGDVNIYKNFEKYYMLKDKGTGITLGFIIIPRVGKVGAITYNNIFEITGQALILRPLKFYFDFIKWAGFTIEKFKRVDICLDLAIETQYIYDTIIKNYIVGKTIEPIIKKGSLETIYIGDRNTRKNTYQVIRIYDKIKDTIFKKKGFLYDFTGIENLTRFEVEIRRDKAKFMTEKKLLDDEYIFSVIVNTFYKMNYQFFKFLHLEDFKRVKLNDESVYEFRRNQIKLRQEDFIKYGNDFKNETEKQKTLKMFVNCAKRLFKSGTTRETLLKVLSRHGITKKNVEL